MRRIDPGWPTLHEGREYGRLPERILLGELFCVLILGS
jgi:hypothetical protein